MIELIWKVFSAVCLALSFFGVMLYFFREYWNTPEPDRSLPKPAWEYFSIRYNLWILFLIPLLMALLYKFWLWIT